jgi:aldose 1-epimerase
MRKTITIAAGGLRAEIVPSLGGGLAHLDMLGDRSPVPIFRPWPEGGTDDPNRLASYVLVPWSNRISGRGFRFEGRFHPLEPNFPGEPFPLHGKWLDIGMDSIWAHNGACIARLRFGWSRFLPL